MTIIRSTSADAHVEINLDNYTITGHSASFGAQDILVRLLLTDIGVEAGAEALRSESTSMAPPLNILHHFSFSGDIVHAALWLRTFRLVATCSDGQTREIMLSKDAAEELVRHGTSTQTFGHIAFRGNSWLFANRFDFAGEPARGLPSPGDLPVFGIVAAAFGDSGWFDDEGRRTAAGFFNQVPRVFEAMAIHGRLILLIDASNEGQPLLEDWMALVHHELERRGISPTSCVLLQQNRNLKSHYESWAKSNNVEAMRVLVYDYYPRRMVGMLSQQPLETQKPTHIRSKKLCCLNFTPRPNRTSLVSWLLAKNFDREGFLSFGSYGHEKSPSQAAILCDWFPDQKIISAGLELLKTRAPLLLDLEPGEREVPEYNLGPASIYHESYFSLVTETEVSNGDVVRISEKSIKPLAMHHPAIILGNPYSLEILRGYGFKTFGDFFDESYDTIEDPAERVRRVMAEIERLMSYRSIELHDMYWKIWPTLTFNAAHARRVLNEQFKYQLEPSLLESISRFGP